MVIDLKKQTEIVLENPSEHEITAIYVDESSLMIGCNDKAYYKTPSQLFKKEDFSGY